MPGSTHANCEVLLISRKLAAVRSLEVLSRKTFSVAGLFQSPARGRSLIGALDTFPLVIPQGRQHRPDQVRQSGKSVDFTGYWQRHLGE